MGEKEQIAVRDSCGIDDTGISRRVIVGSSAVTILGLLAGSHVRAGEVRRLMKAARREYVRGMRQGRREASRNRAKLPSSEMLERRPEQHSFL